METIHWDTLKRYRKSTEKVKITCYPTPWVLPCWLVSFQAHAAIGNLM